MEANTQLINYNLMASLRTGNVIIDMAIAMFVPQLMTLLVNVFNQMIPWVQKKLDVLFAKQYRRKIIHSYEAQSWIEVDKANRNSILQNAIRQYVGRVVRANYPDGIIKLTKIESGTEGGGHPGRNNNGGKVESLADQLDKNYHLIHLPQNEVMEEIEPGLFFAEYFSKMDEEQNDDERKTKRTKDGKSVTKTVVTMVFETSRWGGEQRVNAFIAKAYDWFTKEVEKDEDHSRFMYQPLVRDRFATIDERKKPRIYKRYELSSDKTFQSLFFPEKQRLLRILEHFSERTGKYAIKGFPHKLGLLLHGPPGTGKTSLVKAIATHTNRSIISVPLSRMHTNQELMDVMFDEQFNFKAPKKSADEERGNRGADIKGTRNTLSFKDVIFLLEDVDAASDVVHARVTRKSTMAKKVTHSIERQYTDIAETPSVGDKKDDDSTATAIKQQEALLKFFEMQKKNSTSNGNEVATGDDEKKKKSEFFISDKDKLSLSGLLTVLDGVIDAPGRILIMTTNHPEKLDPALTRPGRVNMQIYMGFMRPDEAKQMVKHYYPSTATDEELGRVERTFEELGLRIPGGFRLSPAEMEQLCAECVTISDLVQRLLAKADL